MRHNPSASASDDSPRSNEFIESDEFIEYEEPSLILSLLFPALLAAAAVLLWFERQIPYLSNVALAGTRRYHAAAAVMLLGLALLIHLRTFWDAQRENRWYVVLGYIFGFVCMVGAAGMVVMKFLRVA